MSGSERSATWALSRAGELGLAVDQEFVHVTSAEIYSAEYEGISNVQDYRVSRPTFDIHGLDVSPMLALVAVGVHEHRGRFRVELDVEGLGRVPAWPLHGHAMVDKRWAALDPDSLADIEAVLDALSIKVGDAISVSKVIDLVWNQDIDVRMHATPAEVAANILSAADRDMAKHVSATLYPYQEEGAAYIDALAEVGVGSLLADEMGLGKTLQAIAVMAKLAVEASAPMLVVAPASLTTNWQREIERFAPQLVCAVHEGPARSGNYRTFLNRDITIVTYDTLTRDAAMFAMVEWRLVVLDEAQLIKNPETRRSIAAKDLRRRASLALTGTPVENSLTDLWSILEFVLPGLLGTQADFEVRYPETARAAEELSERIGPLVLRRTVAEVAGDLPHRVDIRRPLKMPDALAGRYEAVRTSAALHLLARLMELRRLSADAERVNSSIRDEPGGKREQLSLIATAALQQGEKLIVFSAFQDSLDEIAQTLRSSLGPGAMVEVLDGRMDAAARQAAVDRFTAYAGPAALAMNPRATGVGLNIQAATYVIHYSPEWNPAVMAQASARAHRRGQTKPVFVYYFYYEGSVEEVMMERLDEKSAIATAAGSRFTDEATPSEVLKAIALSPVTEV